MYADVNITSLTRNSSSVSVSGQVALIYVNTAGGTGSYSYNVSGAVQGGNTVTRIKDYLFVRGRAVLWRPDMDSLV